jgi:copper homeostasis protein
MDRIVLEVCVDSVAGVNAAVCGGADRIELCQALAVGGLTPSIGMMRSAGKVTRAAYAMIRPRAGDFVYSAVEVQSMIDDISAARDTGLAGVVLGAMTPARFLDFTTLETLVHHASGMDTTLHRVSDLIDDEAEIWIAAVAELGVSRVLTTGRAANVEAGFAVLKRWADIADGRLVIMPGGGVRPENLLRIVCMLPVAEIHSSCSQNRGGPFAVPNEFGAPAHTDEAMVRQMRQMLDACNTSNKD